MPQLDGIRAFAILSVLISHFLPQNDLLNQLFHFGRAGVIIFFVLSGYLITGILLRYRDLPDNVGRSSWHRIRVFYARRILRIFPIYYLTILIAAILGYAPVRDYLLWHIFYLSNMASAFQGINFGNAGHFWSLCVEEQFYLLWPLIVIFTPKQHIHKLAMLLIVVGISYKWIGALWGLGWVATNFVLMGCVDSLGLGALIAIYQHQKNEAAIKRLSFLSLLMGPLVFLLLQIIRATVSFDIRNEPYYQSSIDMVVSLAFTPILLNAIYNVPGKLANLLTWQPIRYIGKISYGVYLYHLFLLTVLPWLVSKTGLRMPGSALDRLAIFSSVAILIAAISWHLIEKPINNLKKSIVLHGG